MTMDSSVVTVRNLSVRAGRSEIVRDVSFVVRQGECVVLTGKSGSGKTTVIQAVCRNIHPSGGVVEAPARIGLVSQDYSLFSHMRVGSQIAFGLHDRARCERRSLVAKWLGIVGLVGYERRWPWELSGGERQRVAIARALAPDPTVICMDEPLAALDLYTRTALQDWLRTLLETTGKTILYVTHSLDEAIVLGDRCLVLSAGRLIAEHAIQFARPRRLLTVDPAAVSALKNEILASVFSENTNAN